MTSREIKAKVERSSLGTKSAQAARRTVPNAVAQRLVARAQATGQFSQKNPRKSGG